MLKRNIILDFDDTIARSSDAFVKVALDKYPKYNTKRLSKSDMLKEFKCWNYNDILPTMPPSVVEDIFQSDDFFACLDLQNGFSQFYQKFYNKYNFVICSCCNDENAKKKKKWLDECGIECVFVPVSWKDGKADAKEMQQYYNDYPLFCVDDNYKMLIDMPVGFKILMKNYKDTEYNQIQPNDEVYVVNDWYDIIAMCEFDENMKGCLL